MGNEEIAGCMLLVGYGLLMSSGALLVGHLFGAAWGWATFMAIMGLFFLGLAAAGRRKGGSE